MKGAIEVVKGRLEEGAGALTGNDKLRAKGRTDQVVGHIKQTAENGVRQAKDSALKAVDKAEKIARKAID